MKGAQFFTLPSFLRTHRAVEQRDGVTNVAAPPVQHRTAMEADPAGGAVGLVRRGATRGLIRCHVSPVEHKSYDGRARARVIKRVQESCGSVSERRGLWKAA